MTTDAEVQTVVYIPLVRKAGEPRPDRVDEEVEVQSETAKEKRHANTNSTPS